MGFHLHRNGQSIPYELGTLREMARKGELAQDEYIYDDTKSEWIGAAQVPEMAGAWNIGEDERTVAMELPAEFLAQYQEQRQATPEPEPIRPVEPMRPVEREPMRPVEREPMRPVAQERPMQPVGGRGMQLQPGKVVSPIAAALLPMVTCGIYQIVWLYKRIGEINTFLGENRLTWWWMLLPILNIVLVWNMIQALPDVGRRGGIQLQDRTTLLLVTLLCFGPAFFYIYQDDLNKVWQSAGAR